MITPGTRQTAKASGTRGNPIVLLLFFRPNKSSSKMRNVAQMEWFLSLRR